MNRDWNRLRETLREILRDEVSSGRECACQLCIFDHGEPVIDLVAGSTDRDRREEATEETLSPIFSAGKPVLAALAWRMAERGEIAFDTPVAEFWKEFRTPEKSGITLEHLLSHRAGLYRLPSGDPDITDWAGMCGKVAAMKPGNPPGAKCHYHPLTFGWLVGHTLELAAGKPLKRMLEEEILGRPGIAGRLFFGIDGETEKRTAPIDDSLIPIKPAWEVKVMNSPAVRKCCVPSFSGIGNARGLAEFYRRLRGGIVSEAMFDHASGRLFRSPEDPLNEAGWAKFALGIVLMGPPEDRRLFCGHGGAAGAEAFYMPEYDIAFAFVKNRLSPAHPDHPVRDRISDALAIPRRRW